MRKRGWLLGAVLLAAAIALIGPWREPPRGEAPPAPASTPVARRPAPTPAPQPARAGPRIRGTVVDLHGQPVPGVRVSASWPEPGQTLSELPCPPEAPYSDGQKVPECFDEAGALLLELASARQGEAPVLAEATTAADGTFTLAGLPEGPLALWALGEQGAAMHSGIPAGTEGVELMLEPGLTLEGAVHGEGAPLAGVRVTAVSARHTRFFDTTTGADGRFRAGPLPPGAYALLFTKEAWLPVLLTDELTRQGQARKVTLHRPRTLSGRVLSSGAPAPGVQVRVGPGPALPGPTSRSVTADAQGRFTLVLPSGQHTLSAASEGRSALARVELDAQPPPEVVLELGGALQLSGRVLDEARRPVAGARLRLSSPKDFSLEWKTVTDAEGRYTFGPLEPGPWEVSVRAHGYWDPAPEEHTLTPDMGPLDLTLERAPSVEGRVTDTAGRPLPDVYLQLVTPGDEEQEPLEIGDSTDEEGRFVLDAERPGSYLIKVMDERYVLEPVPVRVPARNVHLTVRSGASLVGTVVDARGLPLEGFSVTLLGGPEGQVEPESRSVDTDALGRFSFQGLKRGAYKLVAARQSAGTARRVWRELKLAEEAPLEVELRLPEEHTLAGVVVDTQGRPVSGARVRTWLPSEDEPSWLQHHEGFGAHSPEGVLTGPDGRFALPHLTAARYELRAQKDGHTFFPERSEGGEARESTVRVRPDAAGVRLVLYRRPHLTGRAVGPDGQPLSPIMVNGDFMETPEGRFSVVFRSESDAENFVFSTGNLGAVVRDVEPRPGADVDVGVVRLEPGRVILVRALDDRTKQPVPNILLTLIHEDNAGVARLQVRTDADGIVLRTGLPPGSYVIDVTEAPGYYTGRVYSRQAREIRLMMNPLDSP